jgi:DNA-binding response OmpR family regulator
MSVGYELVRNDRSVDVFVHKLRRKLERHSPGLAYIHTVFGIGCRLAPVPASGVAPAAGLEPLAA